LEKIGYEIDIDTFKCREDHDLLWKELTQTLHGREKAYQALWDENWDYFELVVTGTDRLQHFLWDAYSEKNHPLHENFLDYYRQVDLLVGKITTSFRKLTGDDKGLYLLSDHGFCGIKQEVYLNVWLEQQGYLSFTSPEPKSLNDITSESRAFAMDPNRIYLNLEGKFPKGCVKEADKSGLKQEISTKLKTLKFQGQNIIRDIFDTESIYSGPFVAQAPDLIALSQPGFDMKGSIKKKEIFGRSNLQGMHTWDDAFFWSQEDHGQELRISDLAEKILQHF